MTPTDAITAIQDGFGNTLKSTGIIIGLGVMMGVDVGQMILVGAALSIPIFIAAVLYSKWIGTKIYQIANTDGSFDRKEFKKEYLKTMDQLDSIMNEKELPGLWDSLSPIVVPLILIFCKTGLSLTSVESGIIYNVISLVGNPLWLWLWALPWRFTGQCGKGKRNR